MEGKPINLYNLAKEYVIAEACVAKADLQKRYGKKWLEENWAEFNRHRARLRHRPTKDIREDVLEDKENRKVGVLGAQDRVDCIETVQEVMGKQLKSLKRTAEESVGELEEKVKALEEEQQAQFQEIIRVSNRVCALEKDNILLKKRNDELEERLAALEKLFYKQQHQ